ncbi:MAG TPA: hypothetical protein ENK86_03240 [Campylobacterales bacterium]|nr:hypothetical protein [Campylobacterales bacterium]
MIIQSITKSVPALLASTLVLGLFYWQFNYIYEGIINHFREQKLSLMFAYLFVYLFGIHIITMTLTNLLQYLIKSPVFVFIVGITLLTFYGFSFGEFYHVIEYFIHYPLATNEIMGMMFFIILTFGYTLYSMGILFFLSRMPLWHILILFALGVGYAFYFTQQHALPLEELIAQIQA